MSYKLLITALVISASLVACGEKDTASSGESTQDVSNAKMIDFVTTQDGGPLKIDQALFTTPEAKEFMTTGKNPYIGNADAIAAGKKVYQLYSCAQCHGPTAGGQVGPGLTGPNFNYAKNVTNKGMFETIWHGTNNGMGAKGVGYMIPGDNTQGITTDELLKVIAWVRSMSDITGNE